MERGVDPVYSEKQQQQGKDNINRKQWLKAELDRTTGLRVAQTAVRNLSNKKNDGRKKISISKP